MTPSTPACAGLTDCSSLAAGAVSLYPRVRGADLDEDGSPAVERPSTPACAGLTRTPCARWPWRRLYPRVRGADSAEVVEDDADFPLPPRARG